ncbi:MULTISPECIES: DUF7673 family protein [Pseudomonas]|uniref:DUF7673 family protein n=1 Tax=Pseudomonas TaxID=286 RepID=UPI00070B743F|nr:MULTISPECIES: hypothetical protein [Pseudomonas]KQW11947.1 hypothetical protein ASC85_11510 [Pseudomonas sp. Root401]WHS51995.1 hypothetical protein QLH64_16715 [Pseudomonas brassicacearum]
MSPDRLSEAFEEIFRYEKALPTIRLAGIEALHRLMPAAQGYSGQSGVIGRFLLGLYNGQDYPFDMTELRRLDAALFDDCIAVLRLDHTTEREVHRYFENGDEIWEELRNRWV